MPTWPATIVPYSCSPPGFIDPVLRFSADQGYEMRRSRFSRSRRTYQLVFWETANVMNFILDFIEREIRGGTLSFSWSYPYPMAVFSINAGTPNVLTTVYTHGLQSGDQVVVTGTNSHNNTYTVTRVNIQALQLQGTSGGSSEGSGGLVAQFFPYMVLQLDGDTLAPAELQHSFGPFRDDDSLTRLNLTFLEQFS